ncbi:hypothetical protein IL306_004097 [Fusarium sp. DS 682]|nr:hypothetical protein IL306_004097 [Fusarium sp. DS 682]
MSTPDAIFTPRSPVLASAPIKEQKDNAPDAIEIGAPVQRSENTTLFSRWEKRWISLVTSFAAMFSTLSSFVYLPALTPISRDLSVSITLMNLTVTSYLVVAGIAPAFIGDIADQSGRRPVYILMFLLMLAANLGMANLTRWSALLVLRMILSAGASGTVSVAYGVVADITTTGERGKYIDWNFRRTRHRLGVVDARSVRDIEGFPLEHTRLEGAYLLTIICTLTTVGYGLVVEFKTMTATLITDYNTHRSATAQAASNLIRCVGAGAGTASFEPLIRAIGSGWAFAIYAIMVLLQLPLIWGLKRNGMAWRNRNKGDG